MTEELNKKNEQQYYGDEDVQELMSYVIGVSFGKLFFSYIGLGEYVD